MAKLTNTGKWRVYKLLTFLAFSLPLLILFIVNVNEYRQDSSVFGFWSIVIFALIVFALKEKVVEMWKKNSLLTFTAIWFIIEWLSYVLAKKAILIAGVAFVASLLSSVIEQVANVYYEHRYKLVDGVKVLDRGEGLSDKMAWGEAFGGNTATVTVKTEDTASNETEG